MKRLFCASVLLLTAMQVDSCSSDAEVSAAVESEAKLWLGKMAYEFKGVGCSTADSDGDGYVSCTVNRGQDREPMMIECRRLTGSGCKLAQKQNVVVQRQ